MTSMRNLNRRRLGFTLVLFLLAGAPANAYADPSGGVLFQVLMPALAALWAMWAILANRIRRGLGTIYQKLRGVEPEVETKEPAA